MANKKRLSKLFRTIFDNEYIIHVCTQHTGKMSGMYSISTACTLNDNCKKLSSDPSTICSHCYAQSMLSVGFWKWTRKHVEENHIVLTNRILHDEEIPLINAHSFRFEAFGDLNNTTQVRNYFRICELNPYTSFALWTKRPFLIANTIREGYTKPSNLIIIYSSPMIDTPVNLQKLQKTFPFVDKAFTVWRTADTAKKHGVNINCGARACLKCMKCYRINEHKEIAELLK